LRKGGMTDRKAWKRKRDGGRRGEQSASLAKRWKDTRIIWRNGD